MISEIAGPIELLRKVQYRNFVTFFDIGIIFTRLELKKNRTF